MSEHRGTRSPWRRWRCTRTVERGVPGVAGDVEHRGVPGVGGDVRAPRSPRCRRRCPSTEESRRRSIIGRPRKQGEATATPFPRQREAKAATHAPGTPKTVTGHVASAVNTVHNIYKFAIRQNSQITRNFSKQLEKLQKQTLYNSTSSTTLL